jgi:predicted DNA-binding transcriptional regulator AlpA
MTITASRAIPLKEVAAMFGVTAQTIRKWVKADRFPPPLSYSAHVLVWSPAAIEQALLGQYKAGRKR